MRLPVKGEDAEDVRRDLNQYSQGDVDVDSALEVYAVEGEAIEAQNHSDKVYAHDDQAFSQAGVLKENIVVSKTAQV